MSKFKVGDWVTNVPGGKAVCQITRVDEDEYYCYTFNDGGVWEDAGLYPAEAPSFAGHLTSDSVNHPSHYGQGKIEAIEYIKDSLTYEEYIGYLQGNCKKYQHRWKYKDGLQDLKKAKWYLEELIKTVEEHEKSH